MQATQSAVPTTGAGAVVGRGSTSAPTPGFADLQTLEAYRGARENVFQAEPQLRWFIRTRRPGLVQSGALTMIAGRLMINATRFDEYVLRDGAEVMQRREARKAERQGA